MEPVLVALGRFVAEVPEDAIPVDVRDRAALVLADTVGAILGGGREPEVGRLHAGAERASGPATVLGAAFARVEPWWAIVANGFAGTMLELDEGNRFARGHPAIHVLPAGWRRPSGSTAPARLSSRLWWSATTWRRGSAPRRPSGRGCTCTGSTEPSARRQRSPDSGSSTRPPARGRSAWPPA